MALLSDKINGVKTIIGLQSPAKAGFLQSYGGVTAPSGWLACDGTAVSRTTYSELFANIGTKYGVGDGSTTFNLPSGPSATEWVDQNVVSLSNDNGGAFSSDSFQIWSDSSGNYWIDYSFELVGAGTSATHIVTFGLGGVTFPDYNVGALISGAISGSSRTNATTATLVLYLGATATGAIVTGRASLSAKPSWYDANINSTTIIKSFNDEAKGVTVGIAPATENESGTVTLSQLSSGTTNYVTNGDFEASISTGVSLTTLDSSSETTDPLFDTTSLKLTSQASAGVADFEIAGIDNGVIEAGVTTQVSAYLKTDSAVAEGDWTVGVYNVTDASYATSQTDLKADSINIHRTPFVPLAAKVYVLRVEFTDTTAARDLVVDKIVMTPDSNSALVSVDSNLGDIGIVAGAGWGDATNESFTAYRSGSLLKVPGGLWTAGVKTAADASILLPAGYTIDTTSLSTRAEGTVVGFWQNNINAIGSVTTYNYGGPLFFDGVTTNTLWLARTLNATSLQKNATNTTDFGEGITCFFEVPIVEFADSKVNLLTQEVVQANAKARWTLTTTAAVGNGGTYDFTTESYNVGGFTGAAVKTLPVAGKYEIKVHIYYNSNLAATGAIAIATSDGQTIHSAQSTGGNDGRSMDLTLEGDFAAGVTVRIAHDDATSPVQAAESFLTITRISEYGAFDPIGFGLATSTQAGLVYKKKQTIKTDSNNFDTITVNTDPFGGALNFSSLVIGNSYEIYMSFTYQSDASNNCIVAFFDGGSPNVGTEIIRLRYVNAETNSILTQISKRVEFVAATTTLTATWKGANAVNAKIFGDASNGPNRVALTDVTNEYEDGGY